MAARFSTDEARAAFDEHFVRPAGDVLRGVGSAAAVEPRTIYDRLGALWAQAERMLGATQQAGMCPPTLAVTSGSSPKLMD